MAPELRKRSKARAGGDSALKKASKVTTKRKATEEASPVAIKKQKAVKPSTKPSATSKSASAVNEGRKSKSATETAGAPQDEDVTEEDSTAVIPIDDPSDSDDEIDEDIQALAAGLDPSDDDGAVGNGGSTYKPGDAIAKIPKLSKKEKKALAAKKNAAKEEPGVIYVGRIPHGFYEHALRGFFSQFGKVTRTRLSRNKRTGASKHFAFVEFAEESTSIIAAKTMDGYLLYNHILKVKSVPRDQLHEDIWKGANRRFKKTPWAKIEGNKLARPRNLSTWDERVEKEQKRRSARAEKLKEIGYEFDAPELKKAEVTATAEQLGIEAAEEVKAIETSAAEAEAEADAILGKSKEEEPAAPKAKKEKTKKTRKTKA